MMIICAHVLADSSCPGRVYQLIHELPAKSWIAIRIMKKHSKMYWLFDSEEVFAFGLSYAKCCKQSLLHVFQFTIL